jgi:hypothetical protein
LPPLITNSADGFKSIFSITTVPDVSYYPAFALPLLLITISTAFVANSIFARRDARPLKNDVIKTSTMHLGGIWPFNKLKLSQKARTLRAAHIRQQGPYTGVAPDDVEMTGYSSEATSPNYGQTSPPDPISYGMSPAYGLVGSGLQASGQPVYSTEIYPSTTIPSAVIPQKVISSTPPPPTAIYAQFVQQPYDSRSRPDSWYKGDDAIGTRPAIFNQPSATYGSGTPPSPPNTLYGRQAIVTVNPPMDHTTLETILEQSPPLARNGPSENMAHFGGDDDDDDDERLFEDNQELFY